MKKSLLIVLMLLTLLLSACSTTNKNSATTLKSDDSAAVVASSTSSTSIDDSAAVVASSTSSASILNLKINSISFCDENGKKLVAKNGWIPIAKKTKIKVNFSGSVDQVDFIFTPTGSDTYAEQKIIGYVTPVPNSGTVEFDWTPAANQSMGYINVSMNCCNYSLKSDLINVSLQSGS